MNKKKIISWILLEIWLGVIFFFSSQTGDKSATTSNGLITWLQTFLPFSLSSFFIRKCAHFTEFMILGVLILNILVQYNFLKRKTVILAIVLGVLYAISDEVHQLFVENRGPAILDVFIDSCGVFFGVIVFILFNKFFQKRDF